MNIRELLQVSGEPRYDLQQCIINLIIVFICVLITVILPVLFFERSKCSGGINTKR